MKHLYQLAVAYGVAVMGLTALTGCEGSEMFSINSPEGLSEKIDSIANSKKGALPTISPTTLGATDNSSGWWVAHLDQDICVESGKVYSTTFTNYTSGVNNWNNYVIVLRKADKTEYAVLRSDDYGWGDAVGGNGCPNITHSNTSSADWAAWLSEMDGAKVTVTVTNYGDNTCDVVADVVGNKGTTSTQKYLGIPVEADNLYLDFTTDGCHYVFDKAEVDVTEAKDQQPVQMELVNVPEEVDKGSELKDLTSIVKAKVTFSDGAQKEVDASELTFIIVPAIGQDENGTSVFDAVGERYIVATFGHTLMGKTADNTISASAKFTVVSGIKSITVTKTPARTDYYFYASAALDGVERTLAFDPTGMEVTATYVEGEPTVLDHSKLTFSAVPATVGKHEVTITTENGRTTTVEVNVSESAVTAITPNPTSLGAEDCSTGWWAAFTEDIKVPAGKTYAFNFTNYTNGAVAWNNYLVILRKADLAEYCVTRADNYGWGNGYAACTLVSTHEAVHGDWATWLAAMNGAKVKLYVTNCNNGTADIQAIVTGADGKVSAQSYLGVNTVDPSDLQVAFSVEGAHLLFE